MSSHIIDDSPLTRYHKKLILACAGGPFLDGYLLSVIGAALAGAQSDLRLSPSDLGVAGAISLVGLFLGSLVFGPITDRIGRRVMYTADLLVMIIPSVLCLFIDAGWQLIALRFIIGTAVGADYPIATTLLTEWMPKRQRGPMIGLLSVFWLAGAIVAFLVGFVMTTVWGPGSWRWMLASGAVWGVVILILRMGTHESPRWLIAKGRLDQACRDISSVLGRPVTEAEALTLTLGEEPERKARFTELLRGDYLRRVVFCGVFWTCFALPQFALFTYGPIILGQFGFTGGSSETLGQIVLSLGFLLGALPGMRLVNSRGRRPLILGSFLLGAVALVPLGIWANGPGWFVITFFFLFTFINGAGNILVWIYPNELFPTQMRASAVGLATAISRIGAAIGTYLVPLSLSALGNGSTMLIGAAVTFLGFVISIFWAEETRDRALADAAQTQEVAHPQVA